MAVFALLGGNLVRSFRFAFFAAALAILAALISLPGQALAQDGGVIREIVVSGNHRIEAETVRSYLSVTDGDPFDSSKVDKSLKALFATGLFADVAIRREGDTLLISVVENPLINRVAFEGNKRVKSEQLQTELQLRPRTVFTRTKAQGDVKRIQEIYRRSGRFAVTVEPKLIELEQNRVDLVYEINEGAPTYVTRIDFVGNKKYSDSALKEVLQTKEERWYRFMSSDDSYDPDRVNYDRELMRRFYMKNGYADFRVVSSVAELTPDREKFFLTFTLEEGERYKMGSIEVRSAIPELKVEDLKKVVTVNKGEWYNADEVEKTIQALTDAVGSKGYAFVDIKPILNRRREDKIIDVIFDIQEGPRVFVERIDIQGNVRTLDKVIRREFRLVEGDAFNSAKLRRSRERLKDLDFFQKVDVNNVASETAPDRTVIKVDVQEKATGELSFGVGWSSTVGALMTVGAKERNLLGRGQEISINGEISQKLVSVSSGFTEPYFMDRHLITGVDLFSLKSTATQSTSSYTSKTAGGDLRMGYYYNEYLRHDWTYTASMTELTNISDDASIYVRDQEGTTTLSQLSHVLSWDRRDSRVDPTHGYYVRAGNDLAGLGGNQHFIRSSVGAGQYFQLLDETILRISGTAGMINSINNEAVRINQRFYLGGDTLRGFKDSGVSPRDKSTLDALGGMWDATSSMEMVFPIGFPKEMGVQGKLFTDAGTIGNSDSHIKSTDLYQSQTLRWSVGTGVVWRSPMGPVNVDLGFPLMKDSHDETQMFRLNFGTRF